MYLNYKKKNQLATVAYSGYNFRLGNQIIQKSFCYTSLL